MRRTLSHIKRIRPKHAFSAVLAIVIIAGVGSIIFVWSALSELPSLDLIQNREVSQSTKIYDRTGEKVLYEIYGEEKRTVLAFDQIPDTVKQATIAIEDKGFYDHSAIDLNGIMRAVFVNLRSGEIVEGGSTITQQLAKKAFLSDEQTPTRKLKELIIAYKLEQAFTKDQILNLYLNQIPYGNNAYGIESAALTYFQKSAKDLTLAEAAVLAAVPNAPSYYSPFGNHVKELLERKDEVLQRMHDQGYITEEQMTQAQQVTLQFSQLKNLGSAAHFILMVKDELEARYGEDFVRRAGLKVVTTLDADLQAAAEKAVIAGAARNTELYKGTNAAMVVQDPKTGQILAMVGSRNYFDKEIDGQFNVASQGARQPGSALKPFVYLAALGMGYPESTVLFDVPTEFNTTNDPTKSYKPGDYEGNGVGPVNFRNSLAQSINISAVKTLYLVGLPNFLDQLQSYGITTLTDRSRFGLSLVLGGGEVHLDELVGAYSILAQEGVKHAQQTILSVTDQKGRVLESYKDQAEPVVEPEPARIINDMLSDKNARAPLFHASLDLTVFPGYDVALKTGTTNDYRDAWAMGYTPNMVAGVWAGNNNNVPMERKGGSILAAVPILSAFMRDALPLRPSETFTPPAPAEAVNKPMLSGNHIGYFQSGAQLLPQVHDILYYVDKRNPLGPIPAHPENDPQFSNWESGVLAWAQANIPGFTQGLTYNQQVPPGSSVVDTNPAPVNNGDQNNGGGAGGVLIITSPKAGDFIRGSQIPVSATLTSEHGIAKIEVFFNGTLADTRSGAVGNSLQYQNTINITGDTLPQNTVKIVGTDSTGGTITREVVIYR